MTTNSPTSIINSFKSMLFGADSVGHQGHCQCCASKLSTGEVVRTHIKWNVNESYIRDAKTIREKETCGGSKFPPMEIDRSLTDEIIGKLDEKIAETEKSREDFLSGAWKPEKLWKDDEAVNDYPFLEKVENPSQERIDFDKKIRMENYENTLIGVNLYRTKLVESIEKYHGLGLGNEKPKTAKPRL